MCWCIFIYVQQYNKKSNCVISKPLFKVIELHPHCIALNCRYTSATAFKRIHLFLTENLWQEIYNKTNDEYDCIKNLFNTIILNVMRHKLCTHTETQSSTSSHVFAQENPFCYHLTQVLQLHHSAINRHLKTMTYNDINVLFKIMLNLP
jgi:hypothetical protein